MELFSRRRSGPAEVVWREKDGNTWTLQRSCHGANGQSGAEGQESSAPVWKINDGRATLGGGAETVKNWERGLRGEARSTSARELLTAPVTNIKYINMKYCY